MHVLFKYNGTVSRIDYILRHNISLKKFKCMEFILSIFSDDNDPMNLLYVFD